MKSNNNFIQIAPLFVFCCLILSISSCGLFNNLGKDNNKLEPITTGKDSTKKDTLKVVRIEPPVPTKVDTSSGETPYKRMNLKNWLSNIQKLEKMPSKRIR